MSGHTPGPWTFAMDTEDQVAVLGNKEHPLICTVSKGYLRPHGEANAHLIAAAPDLLEALRRALAEADYICTGPIPHGDCWACEAERAIAKAEGL